MDILIVLLLCVAMAMALTYNESVVDTGVDQHMYQKETNFFFSVPDSEVVQYHRVKAKATKLVYVHFDCNGTTWDVIKVLDEKSKYLLQLGDYETYVMFSLYTLSFGIEHTSVTLNILPQSLITNISILLSMVLVSDDFKMECKSDKCLKDLFSTRTVCIQKQGRTPLCTLSNDRDTIIFENLNMSDLEYFSMVIILLFVIILCTVMTISGRFRKFNFICMFFNSKRNIYTIDDISIAENNNYLIGKQSVPYGFLSILFDIYVLHCFPSVDLWFKNKTADKSSSRYLSKVLIYVSLLNSLDIFLFYASVNGPQLFFTNYLFPLRIVLPVRVSLRSTMVFIDYNLNKLDSVLYGFKEYSCLVLIVLFILALPLIPFYIAFKLIAKCNCYRRACIGQTCRNWIKFIQKSADIYASLIIKTTISFIITSVIVFTLIGITTNSNPYLPLVMASIVYWLKISARLSNWYKCFFETVLDKVISMIEKKKLEVILHSERNCFLVVPSRQIQVQGRMLHVSGTPIFIDWKGTLKLTKAFFHRCLQISNEKLQNNPLRVSSFGVWQLICVNIFLFLIALIIKIFGLVGHLSMSNTTLVSLASGVLPFILDNFIVKDISVSDMGADKILTCYLEHLVNSYEESFVIENYSQTEQIDILCDRNEQPNLVSNGCELITVRSHISPDGQKLITVPSNIMTEHIGEEGDASEMDPLLSFKTYEDVNKIDEEGQERITELQGDPNFIDIK